jgi:hypothetical protein
MARSQQAGSRDPEKMSTLEHKNQSTVRSGKLSKAPGSAPRDLASATYSRRQPTPVTTASSSKRPAKTFLEHFSAAEPIYSSERGSSSTMYHQNPASRSSIGPENFSVVRTPPTLRRRSDQDQSLPRHKSSKRKAEEHAREREVRAMSSPVPIPKRSPTQSQGLLQKETKKIPGDLNTHFERPKSEISLPLPESFSEMNDPIDQHSFKVSAFAILTPRPTIKYNGSARFAPPRSTNQSRASARQLIMEEDFTPKKRIEDLANDLDSGGLRELLERDKRRREKKREGDKAKLHRKLQRRAERQKEDEQRSAQGLEARPSTPKGKSRRVDDGLGVDTEMSSSPPVPESRERFGQDVHETSSPLPITGTAHPPGDDPFTDDVGAGPSGSPMIEDEDHKATQPVVDPFSHPEDDQAELADQPVTDPLSYARSNEAAFPGDVAEPVRGEGAEEPDLPVRSPLSAAENQDASKPVILSPPISPEQAPMQRTNFSQSTAEQREQTPDVLSSTESGRREPTQGAQANTWATFFKRGGRRKRSSIDRGRETPSEFSNTSRESFSRQQPPPVVPPRSFRRSGSGPTVTPHRTRSKFREDLPELPLSPPDSRLQSPEPAPDSKIQSSEITPAQHATTVAQSDSNEPNQSPIHPADGRSLATSPSLPTLDRSRQDGQLSQQRSLDLGSADVPPPILPQSLASVDSEGSWLSGKPVKRSSGPMSHPLRQSQSSLGQHFATASSETDENDVAEDEYFNRLTPAPEEIRRSSPASAMRKASSTVIDLAGDGERSREPEVPPLPDRAEETWHGSVGRQATIVRQTSRAQSNEGLLNEYLADEPSSPEGEASPTDFEPPADEYQAAPVMRARSIDYGKGHIRHISAGSARLLDIRRSSIQSEAVSTGEKSPTAARGKGPLRSEEEENPPE